MMEKKGAIMRSPWSGKHRSTAEKTQVNLPRGEQWFA